MYTRLRGDLRDLISESIAVVARVRIANGILRLNPRRTVVSMVIILSSVVAVRSGTDTVSFHAHECMGPHRRTSTSRQPSLRCV